MVTASRSSAPTAAPTWGMSSRASTSRPPTPVTASTPSRSSSCRRAKETNLSRLTVTDITGRFYLKLPQAGGRFAGYYASLDALRPLLAGAEWQAAVTGYYLNVAGDFDAVRLTYLTTTPEQVRAVVEAFAAARGLAQSQPPEPPAPSQISGSYGGEELRFRRFLCTYPLITLDLLQADPLHTRCLF